MSVFLYDTNCLVALHQDGHVHQEPTTRDLERRLRAGDQQVAALPCLMELYSVLTRQPPPKRMSSAKAWNTVETLAGAYVVWGLDARETLAELRALASTGTAGAQIYDGLIAACTRKAGAETLVTWNLRHFARFAGDGLAVVNPLGESVNSPRKEPRDGSNQAPQA
jgi:predicted nucleic acid-binding protein